jgi:hypothetical protein
LQCSKEKWEEPSESDNYVLSYILDTRSKLKSMADLATINAKKAKTKQKSYYDKKSRSRKLEVGQKVLVLLPTHTSKLLASWNGPYTIIYKVRPVLHTHFPPILIFLPGKMSIY